MRHLSSLDVNLISSSARAASSSASRTARFSFSDVKRSISATAFSSSSFDACALSETLGERIVPDRILSVAEGARGTATSRANAEYRRIWEVAL